MSRHSRRSRVWPIESSDPNGGCYGQYIDPLTGRFYPCTGAKDDKCTSSIEKALYQYAISKEWSDEHFPDLNPNCINCGEPLFP